MAREAWRRGLRRYRSSPLHTWRLNGGSPSELKVIPHDIRPSDPQQAADYYSGRFLFAGELVEVGGESPFICKPPSVEWQDELHSFRWLRHIRVADLALSKAQGSVFLLDWIVLWGAAHSSRVWSAPVMAARLISWCNHGSDIMQRATDEQQRQFRRSLGQQTRQLAYLMPTLSAGWQRLHASIAIATASVALHGREKSIRGALRDVDREIERHILSDGGPASRNPADLVQALTDLLPLRDALVTLGEVPSVVLVQAIDRMVEALRFFQHSNGELAQFNGTGSTPHLLLALLLGEDLKRNVPQKSAPHTGYERLSAGKTAVIVDVGKPPKRELAQKALAGCLSFELSSNKTVFIINCGVPEYRFDAYAPFVRATAAQSTATIDETSSCQFAAPKRMSRWLPSALISGPERVTVERRKLAGLDEVNASHDGYVENFGLVHRRILQLSDDGQTLNGADRFEPVGQDRPLGDGHPLTLRFHLGPKIGASLLSNGHSVLLAGPGSEAWTFTCVDAPVQLSESMQFTGPGEPRKTQQIVVEGQSGRHAEIRWVLVRRTRSKAAKTKPERKAKSQAAADLLEYLDEAKAVIETGDNSSDNRASNIEASKIDGGPAVGDLFSGSKDSSGDQGN